MPLLIGSNRDEVKFFQRGKRAQLDDEQLARAVAATLPPQLTGRAAELVRVYHQSRQAAGLPSTNLDLLDAISSDAMFRVNAHRLAAAHAAHEPRTFAYLFTHESPARGGSLGACHALEIPFVFGTTSHGDTPRFVGSGPEVEALERDMMDAWLAFAQRGDPSHPGVGTWPGYDDAERATLVLGPERRVERPPLAEELAAWEPR